MTILDYYEGIAAAKRSAASHGREERPMTPERLRNKYGSYVVASRKKKGADNGYKETLRWEWRDYAGYLSEMRELFPREYALMLCSMEQHDFTSDRWWDYPEGRDENIRNYRGRIKSIRARYGLSQKDVSQFMRV